MESFEDIKKMLDLQHREQKRTGNGIYGRVTKVGKFAGHMRTPVDFLKGKEKRVYKGTGKVSKYSMWENEIIPYDKFKKEPVERQIALLTVYGEKFKRKEIMEAWGIDYNELYREWLKPFDLTGKPGPKKNSKNMSNYKKTETANTNLVSGTKKEEPVRLVPLAEQEIAEATAEASVSLVESVSNKVDTSRFYLTYDATVTGRAAAMKLAKFALLLDDDDTTYEVVVQVKEKGD